jgi:uncharacterized protein YqhQ
LAKFDRTLLGKSASMLWDRFTTVMLTVSMIRAKSTLFFPCDKAFFFIIFTSIAAAVLVFDITDADSFAKVQKWVKELRKIVGDDIVLCIAGNKCDMANKRGVTIDQAQA